MNSRKGYVKSYKTEIGWKKEKKDCLIHGFFDWSDGSEMGLVAVVEFDDGTVQELPSEDVVFTEKYIGIGLPITEEPSHTTWHTDRYLGGSADQAD